MEALACYTNRSGAAVCWDSANTPPDDSRHSIRRRLDLGSYVFLRESPIRLSVVHMPVDPVFATYVFLLARVDDLRGWRP